MHEMLTTESTIMLTISSIMVSTGRFAPVCAGADASTSQVMSMKLTAQHNALRRDENARNDAAARHALAAGRRGGCLGRVRPRNRREQRAAGPGVSGHQSNDLKDSRTVCTATSNESQALLFRSAMRSWREKGGG